MIPEIIPHRSWYFPRDMPTNSMLSNPDNSSLFLSEERISAYTVNFIPPRSGSGAVENRADRMSMMDTSAEVGTNGWDLLRFVLHIFFRGPEGHPLILLQRLGSIDVHAPKPKPLFHRTAVFLHSFRFRSCTGEDSNERGRLASTEQRRRSWLPIIVFCTKKVCYFLVVRSPLRASPPMAPTVQRAKRGTVWPFGRLEHWWLGSASKLGCDGAVTAQK